MKISSLLVACTLLLADSCGAEKPAARENPDPKTTVQATPAPTPQRAAKHADSLRQREEASERRYQERAR